MVVCSDVPNAESALHLAARIQQAITRVGDADLDVAASASVGVACVPAGTVTAGEAIAHADAAMYAAKRAADGKPVLWIDPARPSAASTSCAEMFSPPG